MLTVLTLHMIFSFNDTPSTDIYTLSLHDALPISSLRSTAAPVFPRARCASCASKFGRSPRNPGFARSEEHTSELQSHSDLVCRLLLEKKNANHEKACGAEDDHFDIRSSNT